MSARPPYIYHLLGIKARLSIYSVYEFLYISEKVSSFQPWVWLYELRWLGHGLGGSGGFGGGSLGLEESSLWRLWMLLFRKDFVIGVDTKNKSLKRLMIVSNCVLRWRKRCHVRGFVPPRADQTVTHWRCSGRTNAISALSRVILRSTRKINPKNPEPMFP